MKRILKDYAVIEKEAMGKLLYIAERYSGRLGELDDIQRYLNKTRSAIDAKHKLEGTIYL